MTKVSLDINGNKFDTRVTKATFKENARRQPEHGAQQPVPLGDEPERTSIRLWLCGWVGVVKGVCFGLRVSLGHKRKQVRHCLSPLADFARARVLR